MATSVTYGVVLDVRRETVLFLSGLLHAERRRRGTRAGRRAMGCFAQAVLVLRWFLDGTRLAGLARDNTIGVATGYRYLHEAITVLAAQRPSLHAALLAAKMAGHFHLNVGGCDTTDPAQASLSGPAPYWQSYSYDLTGNRVASTDHATTPGGTDHTTTETYDGLDTQHAVHTVTTGDTITSWDYDADGRPTGTTASTGGVVDPDVGRSFTWNPAGKLATLTIGAPDQPTHSTGYGYDTDGNLIARTVDGATTVYLGDDTIHLSGGSVTEVDRTYSFPGGPTTVRVATAGGSSLHWQAADPHGTGTVDITADALTVTRRLSTPFGQNRTPTEPNNWAGDKGFVGGTQDTTNHLTNLGAREYSPPLGRFLNPDPVLDHADPQQWNGYAYANNTPTNAQDSSGKILACGGLGGSDPGMGCRGSTPGHPTKPNGNTAGPTNWGSAGGGSSDPFDLLGPTPPPHPTKKCKSGIYGPAKTCLTAKMPQVRQGNLKNGADAKALLLASTLNASCFFDAEQIICTSTNSLFVNHFGHPITIGDVLLFPRAIVDLTGREKAEKARRALIAKKVSTKAANLYGPDLLRHEAIHSRQWASMPNVKTYTEAYEASSVVSRALCGDYATCNPFEIQANLYWGGYKVLT